jgi:hypothetical protein
MPTLASLTTAQRGSFGYVDSLANRAWEAMGSLGSQHPKALDAYAAFNRADTDMFLTHGFSWSMVMDAESKARIAP